MNVVTMRRTALLSAALLALASATVWAQETTPTTPLAAETALPAIRVVPVERRELVEILPVTGTIVARDEAATGVDLNGLVVLALNADQGDRVHKGEVLAVLDRSMLDTQLAQLQASRIQGEASVAQTESQIADAEVAVKQGREGLDRAKALQSKGFAAQSSLDQASNADASARAKLTSAQKAVAATKAQLAVIDAQMEGIRVQIAKTQVRAPADGLILARSATVGGIVSPNSGSLFRMAIDGDFELEANVAETSLPKLQTSMKASVSLPGVKNSFGGTIRRISPEIDQKTRLGPIRIALDKSAPARAGGFARAEIEVVRRQGLAVPASAIIYHEGVPVLQLVENGLVRSVPVEIGVRTGKVVEVLSGLTEGQEVVARAGTFVADGDRVNAVRDDKTATVKP